MIFAVPLILNVHQNIIEVYNSKETNKSFKHLIHYSHKRIRSIRQIKWHYKPFLRFLLRFKDSFLLISFSCSHLEVATS